ncbi:hypothetical protein GH714_011438 [Hevea brasiliensis]|uniref:Uncharacterized protein n=1 Tax=Hevea brasiliensis TaxID=3981 RepID=A0A6A6LFR6_HEVBR|nr:hypothetical protein GH714_011438 [Hevea brasiliensis]
MCNTNFLVCKMGLGRVPVVLSYGLETNIMPRCSVIRVLLLKGFIKADIPVSSVLTSCEKCFLKRYAIGSFPCPPSTTGPTNGPNPNLAYNLWARQDSLIHAILVSVRGTSMSASSPTKDMILKIFR